MHYRSESAAAWPQTDMPASVTERIWIEFHDQLRGFLLARVRDEHAADDILQDVFLKVHKSIDTLRDDAKLAPWLYQIARNAITDYYRQRPHDPLEPDFDMESPEEAHSAEETLAVSVGARIHDLPERYREALMLTEIEGLSQAEMAARLNLSLSGGKSRVQRGREMIKELLLECCHIEFDRCGRVLSYEERAKCCATPQA